MSGSPRCQHSWLVGREAVVSARVSVESLTHSRTSTRCRRPTEFLQTKNLSCPPKNFCDLLTLVRANPASWDLAPVVLFLMD